MNDATRKRPVTDAEREADYRKRCLPGVGDIACRIATEMMHDDGSDETGYVSYHTWLARYLQQAIDESARPDHD